jgi:hypothetical protein
MSAQLATAVSTNEEMEALSRRLCDEVAAWRFEYSPARRRPHHKAVRSRHAWHVSWIVGGTYEEGSGRAAGASCHFTAYWITRRGAQD